MNSAPSRADALALALVLTFASHALPWWLAVPTLEHLSPVWQQKVGDNLLDLWALAFGLLLALPTARRSGLCVGNLRRWPWVATVCGLTVLATAIIYPRLPERPFVGERVGFWLISPFAQDLVFTGYLYGMFEPAFPGAIHPAIPLQRALILSTVFFSLWHLPNFISLMPGYVAFQLVYTFFGGLWVGLARQWTGSVLYGVAVHMACNFIGSRS
jgi:membrane protease YdiL (CAAX protease family)